MKKTLLYINLFFAVLLALSYLSPIVDPLDFWPLALLSVIYPILLFINVLFALFWLSYHMPYSLISVLACGIGFTHIPKIFNFSSQHATNHAKEITVVSYNTGNAVMLYNSKQKKQKRGKQKMAEFIQRMGPVDVYCFQETQGFMQDIMTENFGELNIHNIKGKGATVYTKYPIINKGQVDFGTRTNSCLWADIKIDIDTFRVYSVHLQSNAITHDAQVVANADINDQENIKTVKNIVKKYKHSSQKRSSQVKRIKAHMKTSPHPIILGGDFNDTPLSYTYTTISEGLQDCFREQGTGFAMTYAGVIPFLRIDYILADPRFDITNHKIVKEKYSDHYPIIASLQLKSI